MKLEYLQLAVFFVFAFSLVAYATLDGFDLGVGCLHLFAKGDKERRLMINSIGPVWDSNTTWIVIGGGILLAGFPKIFASLMSNFYTPMMVIIFGFSLRGAAIEFRSKHESKRWRNFWDGAFFVASACLAFSVGLMLGNFIEGMPIDMQGNLVPGMGSLITPYTAIISCLGVSIFMMHGSLFLLMKTEDELHDKMRLWAKRLIALFLILWAIATVATFYYNPRMVQPFKVYPWMWIFPILTLGLILAIPSAIKHRNDGWAFISSCFSIVSLLVLFLIGNFPNIVYSTLAPEASMTLFNSTASRISLWVLVIISSTGIPLSFFYASYVYRIFRGKIKLDSTSY